MAGITGYESNSWLFGQRTDAFPDKTLSQRKWDAYIAEIDSIEEEIRRQVQSEGDRNLQVADAQREEHREVWAEEWEKFVAFSKVNMERIVKEDEGNGGLFASLDGEELLREKAGSSGALKVEAGQSEDGKKDLWFPYDCLSQDGATITYNGITFQCNSEEHTISLGDTTNKKDTIVIPLSGGGTLLVNKNKIPSLGKAIGMFSPEDIGIILRTVAEYQRITSLKYEMEEDEEKEMEEMTEGSSAKLEESKSEDSSGARSEEILAEKETVPGKETAGRERTGYWEDPDREEE